MHIDQLLHIIQAQTRHTVDQHVTENRYAALKVCIFKSHNIVHTNNQHQEGLIYNIS